jgi:hypothetical protein
MEALITVVIIVVAFAIVAGRYGVDPRDGSDWSPPNPRSRGRL